MKRAPRVVQQLINVCPVGFCDAVCGGCVGADGHGFGARCLQISSIRLHSQSNKSCTDKLTSAEGRMERIAYLGLPNCYRLANDECEVVVTTDAGPRII